MIYDEIYMGGVLVHGERSHKYIDKIRTKAGKWRYIYRSKHGAGWRRPQYVYNYEREIMENKMKNNGYTNKDINMKKGQIHEEKMNDIILDHIYNDRTTFESYSHRAIEEVKNKVKRTLNKLANKIISKP